MSSSLQPSGLQPTRLLCPWGSPGKSTGVGWHALRQGIFLTGDQTCISYTSCIDRWVLYHWCHLGSPRLALLISNSKQSSDYFTSTSVSLSVNCCNGFITVLLFLYLRIKQAQLMFMIYIKSKSDIYMPFSFYSFPFGRVGKPSVK